LTRTGIDLPGSQAVVELVSRFGGRVDAEAAAESITRVVSPEHATRPNELVVLTSARRLDAARRAPGIVLCSEELVARLDRARCWAHAHAMWVVARLVSPLVVPARPGAAPDAVVEPGASVASDVALGPGAVVLSGARIGEGSQIGAGAVIFGSVVLQRRVVVGPLAVVGRPGFGWVTGPDGNLERMPQLGGVVVEDDVEIGPLCTVDSGTLGPTLIKRGAKLDAHVHVGHNAEIGEHTLIAAQSGFAGSARIGRSVLVAGQVGVADHVCVGDGARLSAKSGVIGDVPAGAVVAGFPAVARITWLRAMAVLLGRRGRR
jgi:UDP-3-O-[3-hydroxymyristoyl] glucosamine N-acyltransferase